MEWGNVFFLYKRLISGIEQNQSVVGECVVPPIFSVVTWSALFPSDCSGSKGRRCQSACPVSWEQSCFRRYRHVGYVAPFAVFFQYSGTATHYVAVLSAGIRWVCHSHGACRGGENHLCYPYGFFLRRLLILP